MDALLTTNINIWGVIALVLLGIIAVCFIICLLVREFNSWFKMRYRWKKIEVGGSPAEFLRTQLDNAGLNDVKIKVSFFLMGYSFLRKKIYLKKRYANNSSVVGYTLAFEYLNMAKAHAQEDKNAITCQRFGWLVDLNSIFFVPLVLIGFILDIVVLNKFGLLTFIFALIGLIFWGLSFKVIVAKYKVLKQAVNDSKTMVADCGFYNEKEIGWSNKIYKNELNLFKANAFLSMFKSIYYVFLFIYYLVKSIFAGKLFSKK